MKKINVKKSYPSNTCYDACKSGARVAQILCGRKRNESYMNLVKQLKRMIP